MQFVFLQLSMNHSPDFPYRNVHRDAKGYLKCWIFSNRMGVLIEKRRDNKQIRNAVR